MRIYRRLRKYAAVFIDGYDRALRCKFSKAQAALNQLAASAGYY